MRIATIVAAWCLASATALAAGVTAPKTVQGTVPGTRLTFSLQLAGFTADRKPEAVPRGTAVLSGHLAGTDKAGSASSTSLSVLADPDVPHRSAADWCKARNLAASDKQQTPQYFSIDDIACVETGFSVSASGGSANTVAYQAFLLAQGYCFEIGLVSVSMNVGGAAAAPVSSRDDFITIVKSFAVSGETNLVDAKASADPVIAPPRALAELQAEASAHAADLVAWLQQQCAARPADYVPQFVLGENGMADGYRRACELLTGLASPAKEEVGVWLKAESAWAAALYADGKFPDAMAHFAKASSLAQQLKLVAPRAGLAFDVSRCMARGNNAPEALRRLKEAIASDPAFRDRASTDPAFDKLRASKGFKDLVAK